MTHSWLGFVISVGLHAVLAVGLYGVTVIRPQLLGGDQAGSDQRGSDAIFVSMLQGDEAESKESPAQSLEQPVEQAVKAVAPEVKKDAAVDAEVSLREPKRQAPRAVSVPQKMRMPDPVRKTAASAEPKEPTSSIASIRRVESSGDGAQAAAQHGGLQQSGVQSVGGSGMSGIGDGPRLVRSPKPPYPRAARRDQFEGRVVLDIVVEADGSVGQASVVKSSGREDCDAAAQETIVNSWRFSPARMNGVAVAWRERVAVSYQLR